jgi:hypothetical protein
MSPARDATAGGGHYREGRLPIFYEGQSRTKETGEAESQSRKSARKVRKEEALALIRWWWLGGNAVGQYKRTSNSGGLCDLYSIGERVGGGFEVGWWWHWRADYVLPKEDKRPRNCNFVNCRSKRRSNGAQPKVLYLERALPVEVRHNCQRRTRSAVCCHLLCPSRG